MTSILSFDHAIIAVHDLEQAEGHFQSLGFTTFFGGKHANGETQNHYAGTRRASNWFIATS